MAFGFMKLEFESRVTSYADEKTPLDLCGVKMLPIIVDQDGAMNESLDIIKKHNNGTIDIPDEQELLRLEDYVSDLGKEIHSLAMPYFIWTAEFDDESRKYFQTKKEKKRGPFSELMLKREEFIQALTPKLKRLEDELQSFYQNDQFGLKDIIIASHLWAMFIVPEFQYSKKVYDYLTRVKELTHFKYHQDYMS